MDNGSSVNVMYDNVFDSLRSFGSLEARTSTPTRSLASSVYDHLTKPVLVETLEEPSVLTKEVMVQQVGASWMSPIMAYLTDGTLPDEKNGS